MSEIDPGHRDAQRGKNCVAITFIICATIVCLASVAGGTWVMLELIKTSPW